MAYIYVIKNDVNKKCYVGKTNFSVERRFKEHLKNFSRESAEKRPLYNAMNKYGKEHFFVETIEEVDVNLASEREKYWIEYYDSYKNGYNATLGGDGKTYLNYEQILDLYDSTFKSTLEIAEECNCSADSVKRIVSSYRDNVDWQGRYLSKPESNIKRFRVKCIETGQEFRSGNSAGEWLVQNGKVTSQSRAKVRIIDVCRGKGKTVGGYHWKFVDDVS